MKVAEKEIASWAQPGHRIRRIWLLDGNHCTAQHKPKLRLV